MVCDSRERALELRAELQRTLTAHVGRPIGEVLPEYLEHMTERGLLRETVRITGRHLEQMLPAQEPLTAITPERAQALYDAQVKRVLPGGQPLSASMHQTHRFAAADTQCASSTECAASRVSGEQLVRGAERGASDLTPGSPTRSRSLLRFGRPGEPSVRPALEAGESM